MFDRWRARVRFLLTSHRASYGVVLLAMRAAMSEDADECDALSSCRRRLLNSLTETPTFAPLDWTRSRVRRKHLISLGVPVDLDEASRPRRLGHG
jgi:hypothetical protein